MTNPIEITSTSKVRSSGTLWHDARRPHYPASATGTGYHYLNIIDDAWAADKLSDVEIDETTTRGAESQISSLLEDEGEMDDGIVTAANSGSAAGGALERRVG